MRNRAWLDILLVAGFSMAAMGCGSGSDAWFFEACESGGNSAKVCECATAKIQENLSPEVRDRVARIIDARSAAEADAGEFDGNLVAAMKREGEINAAIAASVGITQAEVGAAWQQFAVVSESAIVACRN